jgi:hypothetical protein
MKVKQILKKCIKIMWKFLIIGGVLLTSHCKFLKQSNTEVVYNIDSIQRAKFIGMNYQKFLDKEFTYFLNNDTLSSDYEYSFLNNQVYLRNVSLFYKYVDITVYFFDVKFQDKSNMAEWNFEKLKKEKVSGIELRINNKLITKVPPSKVILPEQMANPTPIDTNENKK